MKTIPVIRVRFWDQMVLIGIGLALFYTIFEAILSIFLQVNLDFMQRIFGAGPSTIYGRLTILCLFAIFGSHAQYTINQRKNGRGRPARERGAVPADHRKLTGGVFRARPERQLCFFNEATCGILGYAAHELGSKGQSDVAEASSRGRLGESFERVLASGETAKFCGLGPRAPGRRQTVCRVLHLAAQGPQGPALGFQCFPKGHHRAQALRSADARQVGRRGRQPHQGRVFSPA